MNLNGVKIECPKFMPNHDHEDETSPQPYHLFRDTYPFPSDVPNHEP